MGLSYKNKLSDDKINQVLDSISGLTRIQWDCIKGAVDYVYSTKAAKTRFDSPDEVEAVKTFLAEPVIRL